MKLRDRRKLLGIAPAFVVASALATSSAAENHTATPSEKVIYDFESRSIPENIKGSNVDLSAVDHAAGKALKAVLSAKGHPYTSISIKPESPLDLSMHAVAGVAMDIWNVSEKSVRFPQVDEIVTTGTFNKVTVKANIDLGRFGEIAFVNRLAKIGEDVFELPDIIVIELANQHLSGFELDYPS